MRVVLTEVLTVVLQQEKLQEALQVQKKVFLEVVQELQAIASQVVDFLEANAW